MRLRTLAFTLSLAACGDSGSDSAGATMLTSATATATATVGDGTTTAPDGGTTQIDLPTGDATTTADAATTGQPPADATTTAAADTTTMPASAGTTTADDDTTTTADDTTTTAPHTCGDGMLDPGETCDDGTTPDCATTHDGGEGTCVPLGECSPDYVLSGQICVQALVMAHVHVMVSNTCDMTVDPQEFSVEPGQKLKLEYHNHSVDYPIDVWMHYNGGYTDLEPGGTWPETYEHCFGPNPSEGYADISTACSMFHLPIHCL